MEQSFSIFCGYESLRVHKSQVLKNILLAVKKSLATSSTAGERFLVFGELRIPFKDGDAKTKCFLKQNPLLKRLGKGIS